MTPLNRSFSRIISSTNSVSRLSNLFERIVEAVEGEQEQNAGVRDEGGGG